MDNDLIGAGKRRKKASKKHSKRPTQRGGNFLDSIMGLAPALLSALGKKKRATRKKRVTKRGGESVFASGRKRPTKRTTKKRVTKRGGERVYASGQVYASGRKRASKRVSRKRVSRKHASRKSVGGSAQVSRDLRSIKANLKKVMTALNRI